MKIKSVESAAVLDSNGRGAIEVCLGFDGGNCVRAIAPRGSTTGEFEASFLEDGETFGLKMAAPAVASAQALLPSALVGREFNTFHDFDAALHAIDSSPQFHALGGNVAIAASLAFAKALAASSGVPLYRTMLEDSTLRLPLPMFNIIDGAATAGSGIGGIEFLLIPQNDVGIVKAIEMGIRVRDGVRDLLAKRGIVAGDSPQGALLLASVDCEFPLATIMEATTSAGYAAGADFTLGLDLAATNYFSRDGTYIYPWPALETVEAASPDENLDALCSEYARLTSTYPISFLEDGFAEVDLRGWKSFASMRGAVRMVADDLCASSPSRIQGAYERGLIQGVLVKPNQIGTLTGALDALKTAERLNLVSVVSQRSGENDDDSITHLAIAGRADYMKFGGPSRMDRIIKLNSLLKISRELRAA